MCQKRTDSQTPLSGAWAKVQGHATAQLQLSNQSPVMCQLGISIMRISIRRTTIQNYHIAPRRKGWMSLLFVSALRAVQRHLRQSDSACGWSVSTHDYRRNVAGVYVRFREMNRSG